MASAHPVRLDLHLSIQMHDHVVSKAKKEELTVTQAIREAIKLWLQKQETK